MVVSDDIYDFILLWESTKIGNVHDVTTGHVEKGVQIVSLSDKFRDYNGEFAIRRLNNPLTPHMVHSLIEFRREVKGRKYEESELELFRSTYDGWLGSNEEDLSSIFCSELIAESYQRMGLLTESKPSNEYDPNDFSKMATLELGYHLGTIEYINM